MSDLGETQFFKVEPESDNAVTMVLENTYEALVEKGYNPINQIVGYIMSGDPTYITSNRNARNLILKLERDEIVEEIIKQYISGKGWDKRNQ